MKQYIAKSETQRIAKQNQGKEDHDKEVVEIFKQKSILFDQLPLEEQQRLIGISNEMIAEFEKSMTKISTKPIGQKTVDYKIVIDESIDRPCVDFTNRGNIVIKLRDLRDVITTREEIMHAILILGLLGYDSFLPSKEGNFESTIFDSCEHIQHLELLLDQFLTKAAYDLGNLDHFQNPSKKAEYFSTSLNLLGKCINNRFLSSPHVLTDEYLNFIHNYGLSILDYYKSAARISQLFRIFELLWGFHFYPEYKSDVSYVEELHRKYDKGDESEFFKIFFISSYQMSEKIEAFLRDFKLENDEKDLLIAIYERVVKLSVAPKKLLDLVFFIFDSKDYTEAVEKAKIIILNSKQSGARINKAHQQNIYHGEHFRAQDLEFDSTSSAFKKDSTMSAFNGMLPSVFVTIPDLNDFRIFQRRLKGILPFPDKKRKIDIEEMHEM